MSQPALRSRLLVLLGLGTTVVLSLLVRPTLVERSRVAALSSAIRAAVQAEPRNILDLGQVVRSEWDQVFIFPPYTSADDVNRELGVQWDRAGGVEDDEGHCLLVFTLQGRIVCHYRFRRDYGDFSEIGRTRIPRDEAVFITQQDPQNPWKRLRLANLDRIR